MCGANGAHCGRSTTSAAKRTSSRWGGLGAPRLAYEILDAGAGSLAILPPPHKFFFARENEVNLGYVYYRKDNDTSFSLGVMQPERGQGYAPWGVGDEVWNRPPCP